MPLLNFKEFLNEQEELHLDVNPEIALSQLDKVNADLDSVTEDPFLNSAIFMNTVRGTLERYGILLPPSYVTPTLSVEAETVYTLGSSDHYIYIVHNQNGDGLIEGYAQIVDESDLNDLVDMKGEDEDDEECGCNDPSCATCHNGNPSPTGYKVLPARRDDDSGNDSEY